MKAIELADELDGFLKEQEQLPWGTKQVYLDQAATMLRQQQAEIEALKKELETCKTIVALSNIAWKNKFGDDQ